ncbi:MAG: glycosyl transferase family 2 [Gemmataceae bacterium]|nr:glycosyl transferase family 2 [Gemmataceae bacterium]
MSPRLSVVVPTCRRPDLLARCLAALVYQHLDPTAYEVVVADDAASAAARVRVETAARAARVRVRYVPVTGTHGPAAARNAGWRAARGEVVAFTDDDTVPDPGWLAAGLGAFDRDPDLAAAAGRTEVPLPPRPTDYERNESGLATAEFVTANCFVRRQVLEAVGGFDERFRVAWREDSDLHFTLLERGLKLRKVPTAVVVHPVRPAKWGVSLRMQRKSQYDALLFRKHPALYRRKIGPGRPWDYYAIVAALPVLGGAAAAGAWPAAGAAAAVWAALTGRFIARRLRGNTLRPAHLVEMVVTSTFIPPLSVLWRLYGAARFRARFF